MALIVGGTTVTGTQVLDATKLSGTIPAISGENLTNLPAASSIPAVAIGVVGSFAFCRTGTAHSGGSGGTQAASTMKWTNGNGYNGGTTNLSGTWRVHGVTESGTVHGTVFQRIS